MGLPSPDHLPRGKQYRCFYSVPLLSAGRGGSRRPRLRSRGIDGLPALASAPRPRVGWRLPTRHRSGTTAHCLMECCFTAPRAEPWTGATGDDHRRRHAARAGRLARPTSRRSGSAWPRRARSRPPAGRGRPGLAERFEATVERAGPADARLDAPLKRRAKAPSVTGRPVIREDAGCQTRCKSTNRF